MPSLKSLKVRINSVKSTRKITSAMKMVAAAKLRRAEEQANAARPYAERMERMLQQVAASMRTQAGAPPLIAGTGTDIVHLIVVVTSDRGLCGGFNASIAKETRRQIARIEGEGKTVKILCIGRKGRDMLRRDYGSLIVDTIEGIGRPRLTYASAEDIAKQLMAWFDDGEYDVCTVIYNRFKSVISQIVTVQQIIPFVVEDIDDEADKVRKEAEGAQAIYEFEPDEEQILKELLPRNVGVQVYRSLLESAASEQGARMSAMDNATRNAGEMIKSLTLTYNRTRQAAITSELIEIISGAEAV